MEKSAIISPEVFFQPWQRLANELARKDSKGYPCYEPNDLKEFLERFNRALAAGKIAIVRDWIANNLNTLSGHRTPLGATSRVEWVQGLVGIYKQLYQKTQEIAKQHNRLVLLVGHANPETKKQRTALRDIHIFTKNQHPSMGIAYGHHIRVWLSDQVLSFFSPKQPWQEHLSWIIEIQGFKSPLLFFDLASDIAQNAYSLGTTMQDVNTGSSILIYLTTVIATQYDPTQIQDDQKRDSHLYALYEQNTQFHARIQELEAELQAANAQAPPLQDESISPHTTILLKTSEAQEREIERLRDQVRNLEAKAKQQEAESREQQESAEETLQLQLTEQSIQFQLQEGEYTALVRQLEQLQIQPMTVATFLEHIQSHPLLLSRLSSVKRLDLLLELLQCLQENENRQDSSILDNIQGLLKSPGFVAALVQNLDKIQDLQEFQQKLKLFRKVAFLENGTEIVHIPEIQKHYLPQSVPPLADPHFVEYEMNFQWQPGIEQGGSDYFDFIALDSHRLILVMAQVMANGLAATMYMLQFRRLIRDKIPLWGGQLDRILVDTNQALVQDNIYQEENIVFPVSCIMAMLDVAEHKLYLTTAGHLPAYYYLPGNPFFAPKDIGHQLGHRWKEWHPNIQEFSIGEGHTIFFYSQGISLHRTSEDRIKFKATMDPILQNHDENNAEAILNAAKDGQICGQPGDRSLILCTRKSGQSH